MKQTFLLFLIAHSLALLCSSCAADKPLVTGKDKPPASASTFSVDAFPNPSDRYFNISIRSESNLPIHVKIMDRLSDVIENRNYSIINGPVMFGQGYSRGSYIVEVTQGSDKAVLNVVKQGPN